MANLLDQASIVLTPTAYDNGKVLCAKPSEPPYGDFDFSRNSAATRVNAQGLVENVQILSSNLVQNGDFSEEGVQEVSNGSFSQEGVQLLTNGDFSNGSTDWILDSGWSVSDNKALCDGTNLAYITQTAVLTTGKSYKVRFDIVDYTSGSVKYRDNGFVSGQSFSGVGSYTDYVVAGGGQFRLMSENFIGSIDNVSVREVGQDWTLGTGWSIGEDKAISDGTTSNLDQFSTSIIGKSYKVALTVNNITTGALSVRLGSTSSSQVINITSNGTYIAYGVAETTYLRLRSQSGFDGSVTNISAKEVGQNWDLGDGWSIGDGVAVATSGAATKLTQSISGLSGKKCSVTFTLSNYGGNGNIKLDFGSVVGQNRNANGTYTEVGTYDIDRLEFYKNAGFEGSITNISVIEITDDTNLPRINYEGFSYQDALGSEEVVNGTFATDSDWTKGTGWSISGGSANYNTSSNNTLSQGGSFVDGKTYKVTLEVKSYVRGTPFVIINSGASVQVPTSVGVHTMYLVAGTSSTKAFRYYGGGFSSGGEGSIDNVSVKEYLGQEVVPDSGCGHWLWEPQTTQLVPYSEDFSQSSWSKGSDISIESGYLAPDGNNTAYKVTKTGTAEPYLARNQSLVTTTTRSIYARSVSGTGTATLLSHNSNTNNVFTLTEQWQRFELNNTASPSGLSTFYAADFRGSGTLTEYLVWGANATNDQDYATSYIPSNGSTVTRNQDVCTNGGSLASINSTEGVLYAEIARSEEENLYRLLGIDDGTSNNYVKMGFENSRGAFWIRAVINGVTSISSDNALTSNPNEFYKIAIRYQSGNSAIYINGTSVLTTTTTFSSGNFTALDFNHWNNSLNFFGKTKALAVWKEALSDEELTELTTI